MTLILHPQFARPSLPHGGMGPTDTQNDSIGSSSSQKLATAETRALSTPLERGQGSTSFGELEQITKNLHAFVDAPAENRDLSAIQNQLQKLTKQLIETSEDNLDEFVHESPENMKLVIHTALLVSIIGKEVEVDPALDLILAQAILGDYSRGITSLSELNYDDQTKASLIAGLIKSNMRWLLVSIDYLESDLRTHLSEVDRFSFERSLHEFQKAEESSSRRLVIGSMAIPTILADNKSGKPIKNFMMIVLGLLESLIYSQDFTSSMKPLLLLKA